MSTTMEKMVGDVRDLYRVACSVNPRRKPNFQSILLRVVNNAGYRGEDAREVMRSLSIVYADEKKRRKMAWLQKAL
jgi:hypothetical protein